ncbi:hypothetical protein HZH68_007631 [Vespula germanica]|uniref:Uncharacterized protein n=1 Tax=Vespula germanica TaxID=30212 RepID=A0A834K7Z9_VESGE|nr:hypothetical protein HZH68_007631 [Vespula germanica]
MTIKKLHSQKDQIYMNVIFKEQQPNRSVGGTERKGATLLPAVLVAVDGSPPSLGKRTDDVELRVGVTDVEVGSISNSCSSILVVVIVVVVVAEVVVSSGCPALASPGLTPTSQ